MQYWESNPGSQALAKQNFKTEVINPGINGENYKKNYARPRIEPCRPVPD